MPPLRRPSRGTTLPSPPAADGYAPARRVRSIFSGSRNPTAARPRWPTPALPHGFPIAQQVQVAAVIHPRRLARGLQHSIAAARVAVVKHRIDRLQHRFTPSLGNAWPGNSPWRAQCAGRRRLLDRKSARYFARPEAAYGLQRQWDAAVARTFAWQDRNVIASWSSFKSRSSRVTAASLAVKNCQRCSSGKSALATVMGALPASQSSQSSRL